MRFLESVLPKAGIGAEIGVHKGNFTPVLAGGRPAAAGCTSWTPGTGSAGEWDWGAGDRSTVNALTRIMKRLEVRAGGRLGGAAHRRRPRESCRAFAAGYFDWMYFDTTHTYEQTVEELALAAGLIKPDGIVCGDDWRDDPSHPALRRAPGGGGVLRRQRFPARSTRAPSTGSGRSGGR